MKKEIVKAIKKIVPFLFFVHIFFLGQNQNFYNDRYNYYNMDTTGFVPRGRWDPPDSVIRAWRERRHCFYFPKDEDYPIYKGQDSMLTVFRGVAEMRELKLKNHKIRRKIRQSIRHFRESPVLFMSEITQELTQEEREKYLVLPDSSGFFVTINVTEYGDTVFVFSISAQPNYYLYNYTIKRYERSTNYSLSTSFNEDFIGCFYYDNILCIVCCNDSTSKNYKCCFFGDTDNTIKLHLYDKEIQYLGYRYPYYYIKKMKRIRCRKKKSVA